MNERWRGLGCVEIGDCEGGKGKMEYGEGSKLRF